MNVLNRHIGRIGFALAYLPVLVLVFFLASLPSWHQLSVGNQPKQVAVLVAIFLWSGCVTAWRCHDYGKSARSNFWTEQAPIVGPIFGLWDLLTNPGDTGHNAYGPAPRL